MPPSTPCCSCHSLAGSPLQEILSRASQPSSLIWCSWTPSPRTPLRNSLKMSAAWCHVSCRPRCPIQHCRVSLCLKYHSPPSSKYCISSSLHAFQESIFKPLQYLLTSIVKVWLLKVGSRRNNLPGSRGVWIGSIGKSSR